MLWFRRIEMPLFTRRKFVKKVNEIYRVKIEQTVKIKEYQAETIKCLSKQRSLKRTKSTCRADTA
jgi:hypothetical protein